MKRKIASWCLLTVLLTMVSQHALANPRIPLPQPLVQIHITGQVTAFGKPIPHIVVSAMPTGCQGKISTTTTTNLHGTYHLLTTLPPNQPVSMAVNSYRHEGQINEAYKSDCIDSYKIARKPRDVLRINLSLQPSKFNAPPRPDCVRLGQGEFSCPSKDPHCKDIMDVTGRITGHVCR